MDSWEFLLQKEGSRTWQPIKSSKISIEAGRYRVVAHSNRSNTDVEICVSHESTKEIPPRRRSQKRSRRTNREGLMVVIPFTYLKPGRWELRCGGDIMSDFLGASWQESVLLEVLPTAEIASPVVEARGGEGEKGREGEGERGREGEGEKLQSNPELNQESDLSVIEVTNLQSKTKPTPNLQLQLDGTDNTDNSLPEEITQIRPPSPSEAIAHPLSEEKTSPLELAESEENKTKLTADSGLIPDQQDGGLKSHEREAISPVSFNSPQDQTGTNPILEESLEMLEQILQQVIDPLLQDLEPDSATEPQIVETPAVEFPKESDGLILTLEEESPVAVGESFRIAGVIDLLDVHYLNGSIPSDLVFQGTLRYELRDPQTSKLLLNVQHSLPEQALPLAFNHSLEIPSDCNSRLLLGKVTLYGSTPVALASQPFTVTADLEELLGAIIPGTKVMAVAKMLVLSKELPVAPEAPVPADQPAAESPELATLPLPQTVLNLIDTRQISQGLPLQPVSQQPLPPQIYQPVLSDHKPLKSLQLPNFARIQLPTAPEEKAVEVKQEESVEQLVALAKELFPETATPLPVESVTEKIAPDSQQEEAVKQSEETTSEAAVLPVEDFSSSVWDSSEASESPLDSSDLPEIVEHSDLTTDSWLDSSDTTATVISTADSQVIESDQTELLESPEPEQPKEEDDPVVLDNAFQALNVQNRFWSRLNSLAVDVKFSQWLKSDLSPAPNSSEMEEVSPSLSLPTLPVEEELVTPSPISPTLFAEAEEVTQTPNNATLFPNFDNSMWEEAEDLGSEFADEHQLQLPVLEEETPPPPEVETPEEPPLPEVAQQDWDAQEIVVEDEEVLQDEPTPVRREVSGKVDTWEMVYPTRELVSKPKPVILPRPQLESPIPAPTIVLPTKELTAGETMIVRVKLPPNRTRLAVKLWLQDRQSRYLLDGPRWLMDLLPDGAGKLEAMTQLVVPFGSVDIRFEAIAVDLDSQRESHKVAVDCVVVPSDLVKFGLDEFET